MSNKNNIIDLKRLRTSCMQCHARQVCLAAGLSEAEMRALDQIVERRQVLEQGEQIFHQGQTLSHLHVVRSGAVKTFSLDTNGEEQISGFHLPGEFLGLDAIAGERHVCTAQALESSSVCDIPFAGFEALARVVPGLQLHLLRRMSREIHRNEQAMVLLGKTTAKQRLAAYLFDVSCDYRKQGLSPNTFRLSMTRCDIANYLGLAPETVSRLMTCLQREGVITLTGREVTINNVAALQYPRHRDRYRIAGM